MMMKKGGLNFLSRRNQSLFDTNVQMKDMDSVEFVFDAVMIPDSGTAKVRSRPTVKHFSTFGDGAGFAVPTPTVPALASFTAPQMSHTGRTDIDRLSNGGAISVVNPEEGQILIPPPPSTAPPPPPPQFIPPSPGHVTPPSAFFGEPHSHVNVSTLEPPSMPPPKPPSQGTQKDVDLAMIRLPPMAPPKPPSYQISTVSAKDIPECPKFTPPMPPTAKPQPPTTTVQKIPPPKPTRFSSAANFELPASGSTTPNFTPSERPSSSFSSPNKLFTVPKVSTDQSDRTPPMFLENNSRIPAGVHTQKSEKEMSAPQNVPPVKPVRRNSSAMKLEDNLQDFKENMQAKLPSQPASPARLLSSMAATVEAPPDVPNRILTPVKDSPTAAVLSAQDIIHLTPVDPARKYSPLLNRKLQNLKTNESSSWKEVAASPLALLMAAKEREKQRTAVSRESSTKSNRSVESTSGSFYPSDTRPNSFTVNPRPPVYPGSASPFMEPKPNTENPKVTNFRPELSGNYSSIPTTAAPKSPSAFDPISFIPPPPEFANSDPEDEAPPTMPAPDPPAKRTDVISPLNSAPLFNGPTTAGHAAPITQFKAKPQAPSTTQHQASSQIQHQAPPPTQPKVQPQAPPPSQTITRPQAPPPSVPKTLAQGPPQPKTPAQAPQSVAAGQATLLSILQKKMLEMDPKLAHPHEADSSSDDWSYEDVGGVSSLNSTPISQSSTLHAQSGSLDRIELENKVIKKAAVSASSKQQFGMTFLVRPGTTQPITPVSKTE